MEWAVYIRSTDHFVQKIQQDSFEAVIKPALTAAAPGALVIIIT